MNNEKGKVRLGEEHVELCNLHGTFGILLFYSCVFWFKKKIVSKYPSWRGNFTQVLTWVDILSPALLPLLS